MYACMYVCIHIYIYIYIHMLVLTVHHDIEYHIINIHNNAIRACFRTRGGVLVAEVSARRKEFWVFNQRGVQSEGGAMDGGSTISNTSV